MKRYFYQSAAGEAKRKSVRKQGLWGKMNQKKYYGGSMNIQLVHTLRDAKHRVSKP